MPLKREVLPLLATSVDDRARLAGAANTLVLEPDGASARPTTPTSPVRVAAIRERYDGPVDRGHGARRRRDRGLDCCWPWPSAGARTVHAAGPRPGAGRRDACRGRRAPVGARRSTVGSLAGDRVATATCSSRRCPPRRRTPAWWRAAPTSRVVFEVVYDPWPTPLAAAAERPAGSLVSGLDLLVHQAVLQFELFTGRTPAPLGAMRARRRGRPGASAGPR